MSGHVNERPIPVIHRGHQILDLMLGQEALFGRLQLRQLDSPAGVG
jgi:hypothetical protein